MLRPAPSLIETHHTGAVDYIYDRKINFTCHTSGRGLWSNCESSNCERKIVHKKLRLYCSEFVAGSKPGLAEYANAAVFFSKKYWNVEKHGLIYTDDRWLKTFKSELIRIGFISTSVDFSEHGLQGDNYVHLDVRGDFVKQFFSLLYTEKELLLGSFSNK